MRASHLLPVAGLTLIHGENTIMVSPTRSTTDSAAAATRDTVNAAAGTAHAAVDWASDAARPAVDNLAAGAHEAVDKIVSAATQAADAFETKGDQLRDTHTHFAAACRTQMRERPFKTIGMAVAAGFVLSWMLGRR